MSKYSGLIGFENTDYAGDSVYVERYDERKMYGDVLHNVRRLTGNDQRNSNLTINERISIICTPFARENYFRIRYATYMGVKWKVDSIEVKFPRLILTLGEVFNA